MARDEEEFNKLMKACIKDSGQRYTLDVKKQIQLTEIEADKQKTFDLI